MRIIAGQFRASVIAAPHGHATRPTSDRLRESLFNILTHAAFAPSFEHARVLDLFAGSGALGFEALSRGAAFALFVETARAACRTIATNGKALGVCDRMQIATRDATKPARKPVGHAAAFDLAFIDAPYGKNCIDPCLHALKQGGWMTRDGLAAVETAADEKPDFTGLTIRLERRIGASRIWLLTGFHAPAGQA